MSLGSSGTSGPLGLLGDERSFVAIAQLGGSLATSALTIVGVVVFTHSRQSAYRWFKRAGPDDPTPR